MYLMLLVVYDFTKRKDTKITISLSSDVWLYIYEKDLQNIYEKDLQNMYHIYRFSLSISNK